MAQSSILDIHQQMHGKSMGRGDMPMGREMASHDGDVSHEEDLVEQTFPEVTRCIAAGGRFAMEDQTGSSQSPTGSSVHGRSNSFVKWW